MQHETENGFDVMTAKGGGLVKMWTRGVPVDDRAREQLLRAAQMPFIFKHVAVMPDVHVGICLLYTSPSPRDGLLSRMPSSA